MSLRSTGLARAAVAVLALAPAAAAAPQTSLPPRQVAPPAPSNLPTGFVDEHVLDTNGTAVGLTFDANGRMYVWERAGVVRIVDGGVVQPTPLIDISDEVGNWRDFGMLGFALDPEFLSNGRFYLYYVVDRHHLLNAGTASYDPNTSWYFNATIGRITRYTADPATGYTTTLAGSRYVLLGESPSTGVPILHQSHGTGSLMFGEDGTLLATSGDGASYSSVDAGSASETYYAQALADGIIRPAENVGAFRSQMIGSLNGKVLRIDPVTGDGVPSNPFYDPAEPRAPRSRVWALGLRNPFRASLVPNTGNSDPAVGDPGTVMVGDVGWATWEDVHRVDEPGMNLGWPLFEGLTPHTGYQNARTANQDAPNPLGCATWFDFQDLVAQEQKDHNPVFPNPCDPSVTIAPGTPTFMHRRPELEWRHGSASPKTRTPGFAGNVATETVLGDPGGVEGTPFNGNCAVGGVWHSGRGMPDPYAGAYFVADYSSNWIRALQYGHDDSLVEHPDDGLHAVHDFTTVSGPTFVGEDPADGSLLYLTIASGELRRIRYSGTLDLAPTAVLDADAEGGASPLTVAFDATASVDPEGDLLEFAWDFGDGTTSDDPSPIHTFEGAGGAPLARTVTLTVADGSGLSTTTSTTIGVDNAAPVVAITSPLDGATYSTAQASTAVLTAAVSDAEDPVTALAHRWEVFLHHNTHLHPEPPDTNPSTTVTITPTPCDGEFYAYRVRLTVTDTLGRSAHDEVWLYPDCSPSTAATVSLAASPAGGVFPGESVRLTATPGGPFGAVEFYDGAAFLGSVATAPYQLDWTPTAAGTHVLSALVHASDGTSASSPGLPYAVAQPERYRHRLSLPGQDAEEKVSNGYMRISNPDLELTVDRGFTQLVGLRFPVDVPPGAHVSSAYVQFFADEASSGATSLTIRAEAVGVPGAITSASYDLSSRPRTTAAVPWTPAPWDYVHAGGARQRTPDLAAVLQELVDRPDWSNPGAVLLLFEGVGDRVAEAVDGTAGLAPELVVEFGGGVNAAPLVDAGADLMTSTGTGTVLLGSVVDDGLPNGTLDVTWALVSGPGTASFVDPGAAVTEVSFDVEGTYVLRLSADDGALQASDDVTVVVSDADPEVLEIRLTDGAEDAEERLDTGFLVVDGVDLELGFDGSRPQLVGLRFALDVPQGATITSSWLQFGVDEADTVATDLVIAAEASDDAAPITTTKYDLSSRPTTTASTTWQPPAWVVVGNTTLSQRTTDVKAVLQEIVQRPGWQAGNHVLLLISGSGSRVADSVEGSASRAPLLHVEHL